MEKMKVITCACMLGIFLFSQAMIAGNNTPPNKKNKYVSWKQYSTPATGLFWPEGQALPHFATPAEELDGFNVADKNLTMTERVMFAGLQGLVNKKKPRIFLYDVEREGKNKWPDILQLKIKEYPLTAKWDLIKKYQNDISGVVLYDTTKSFHYINLATTVGGIKNALPVTRGEYDMIKKNGIELPVLADLTPLDYTTPVEIYKYLHDTYWKDCTKRLLVSLNHRFPGYIRDITMASGAAIVWLDPRKEAENKVLRLFLADMKAGESIMIGWWAEERSGIGIGTEYGISTIPADFYENASVYGGMSHIINLPEVPKKPVLENKIYLAIFLSDGDNVQYCQHAMAKLWDKSRGIIPINWTVSPGLVDLGPGLLNYFYRTATPNDFLASGPSGLGYALIYDAHNKKWNTTKRESFDPYAKLTQQYLDKSGLRVITVWDEVNEDQMESYATNCRYLYGVTQEDWEKREKLHTIVKQNKLAFIPNLPCYASGVDVIYRFWKDTIAAFDGSHPLFLTSQGESWKMGPENIVALREQLEKLAPGKIVICRGDHFFNLYNEANQLDFNLTLSPEMKITSSETSTKPEYAADGTPSGNRKWVSSGKGKKWITFDFGKEYIINRYVIRHAGSDGMDPALNTKAFKLETSMDGTKWTTTDEYSGNTENVTDIDISPVKARFVRLSILNPGKDGTARIGDMEIYGKKIN